MIYKKKTSIDGKFAVKGEDIRSEDLITILDEGKTIQGNYGEQTIFKIKTARGEERILSFNQYSLNATIDSYGENASNWLGKQMKVWIKEENVSGKFRDVVYLTHPSATSLKNPVPKNEMETVNSELDNIANEDAV